MPAGQNGYRVGDHVRLGGELPVCVGLGGWAVGGCSGIWDMVGGRDRWVRSARPVRVMCHGGDWWVLGFGAWGGRRGNSSGVSCEG